MKGKKTAILILAILLSSSVFAVFSKNDSFGVDYVFEPVMDGGQWMIKDTMVLGEPGMPLVPYRVAEILLPQGATLKDVKVKHGNPVVQKGFEIPWGQPPCTFSHTPVKVGKSEAVYNSNGWYLGKTFDIVSVESFKGFDILLVHLYPVDYQLKSGTVKFYPKLTVEVQFGKGLKNKMYRGLAADKAAVADMVDNVEVLGTYEDGETPLATEEYIIITNDTMQSTFQDLADWKANFVNGASVYTTTWIYSNYSGTENQIKIRNFIIDKYTNNGTRYVLLGGDVSAVPYRGFYVSTGGYTDYDMAADMYYGHLDGSHNSDGDSYYGEVNDDVDFYADVAVGRAPVDNATEAAAFVNKVIAYEQTDKPKRVCLHQSRVQSGNSPDSRCLAYNCDDYIPGGYTIDYLFEEDGTVSKTDWRNAWAAGPLVVAHIGHGSTDVYYINYEVGGTVSWYNSDVSSLTNIFWPVHISAASSCGDFTANDCLGEEYVKGCKAIAFIGNVNYSWYSSSDACMYTGEFIEMMFKALFFDNKERLGDMLNQARSYMAFSAQSNSTYRWCFYQINLIGDPETPILPTTGSTVSCTVPIEADCSGADTVEFYVDGVLKYVDTVAPFVYYWDTCPYPDGYHAILVNGYASGELICADTKVYTIYHYYVRINNPHEGQLVSGTVPIIIDANCVYTVEIYIDAQLVHIEEIENPHEGGIVQYEWNTTEYSDGNHTIVVKAYENSIVKCEVSATVTVDNIPEPYVTITNPSNGATVSGTVTCTADSNCDSVRWYIDGVFQGEDTSTPFQYIWDTTAYSDGTHTIRAEGYNSGVYQCEDSIPCNVDNSGSCLGTTILLLFILFGFTGIRRRH